jgi:hypothetical protein
VKGLYRMSSQTKSNTLSSQLIVAMPSLQKKKSNGVVMLPNRPSLERVASRQKRYGVRTSRPSSIYTRSNLTAATTSSPSHIRTVERTSAPSLEHTDVSTLESRLLDAETRKILAKYTECDTKIRVDGPRLGVTITCGKREHKTSQSGMLLTVVGAPSFRSLLDAESSSFRALRRFWLS